MDAVNTRAQVRDGWLVPFLDVLLIVVLILLPLVNPPEPEGEIESLGEISIEIRWPDHAYCDVDLWVRAPGERSVGYANSRSNVLSLLRDDLGNTSDLSGLNMEHVFSRGAVNGEYIVNVHMYRIRDCQPPIIVDYAVTRKDGKNHFIIDRGRASLNRQGEEITLVRFSMADGRVDRNSINKLPIKIREAGE